MILARLMVYGKSIEETKHMKMSRSLNSCGRSEQDQPRLKKRAQTQDGPTIFKVQLEKRGCMKMATLLEILPKATLLWQ